VDSTELNIEHNITPNKQVIGVPILPDKFDYNDWEKLIQHLMSYKKGKRWLPIKFIHDHNPQLSITQESKIIKVLANLQIVKDNGKRHWFKTSKLTLKNANQIKGIIFNLLSHLREHRIWKMMFVTFLENIALFVGQDWCNVPRSKMAYSCFMQIYR